LVKILGGSGKMKFKRDGAVKSFGDRDGGGVGGGGGGGGVWWGLWGGVGGGGGGGGGGWGGRNLLRSASQERVRGSGQKEIIKK